MRSVLGCLHTQLAFLRQLVPQRSDDATRAARPAAAEAAPPNERPADTSKDSGEEQLPSGLRLQEAAAPSGLRHAHLLVRCPLQPHVPTMVQRLCASVTMSDTACTCCAAL